MSDFSKTLLIVLSCIVLGTLIKINKVLPEILNELKKQTVILEELK